jgi:ABC-type multidrug transport system fused ATPase/permease subunit
MKGRNRKTLWLFVALCTMVILTTGCTATWISAIGAALPSLSALVTAIATFIAALSGKTVTTAVSNAIAKITADIQTQITNAQTLISAYKNSANQTLVGEISAVLNAIVANLSSILTGANITDAATVGKLAQLVGLGVAAIQAVIALIPLLTPAAAALTEGEVKTLELHHNAFKSTYNSIRTTPANPPSGDVDAALATLQPM